MILTKAKSKTYRVEQFKDRQEVWIYTQPTASGLYQEGVACVVTFDKDKIVERDIRVY